MEIYQSGKKCPCSFHFYETDACHKSTDLWHASVLPIAIIIPCQVLSVHVTGRFEPAHCATNYTSAYCMLQFTPATNHRSLFKNRMKSWVMFNKVHSSWLATWLGLSPWHVGGGRVTIRLCRQICCPPSPVSNFTHIIMPLKVTVQSGHHC